MVYKKAEDGAWEEAGRTNKMSFVVKDLKSETPYKFHVTATNSEIESLVNGTATMTNTSVVAGAGAGSTAVFLLPALIGGAIADTPTPIYAVIVEAGLLLSPVLVPVGAIVAAVAVPVGAAVGAIVGAVATAVSKTGDVSEE